MTADPYPRRGIPPGTDLRASYAAIRHRTGLLAAALGPEDMVVQSMPDASPTKWHLAHTTWFFETFVLRRFLPDYARVEPAFGWLKTIALIRKVRHRGIEKVGWIFTFAAAAYNLVRMRNLLARPVCAASARGEVCPRSAQAGKTSGRYRHLACVTAGQMTPSTDSASFGLHIPFEIGVFPHPARRYYS